MIKQFPIDDKWKHITIVTEPQIIMSLRGWVPAVTIRDETGASGILYLCSYSIYKHLKDEWIKRGQTFKDMTFWIRKAYIGRFSPYEVVWTAPL